MVGGCDIVEAGRAYPVSLNVLDNSERSKAVYQDFLEWLAYKRILDGKDFAGWDNGEAGNFVTSLERYKDAGFHRRRVGLNPIAFQAKPQPYGERFHSE